MSTPAQECDVCAESCNKSSRKPLVCYKCECTVCRECLRKGLLDSIQDPHCIACKVPFDMEQVVQGGGNSWRFQTYRSHRQNILLDRVRAQAPALMPDVQTYKHLCDLRKQSQEAYAERARLKQRLSELENIRYMLVRQARHVESTLTNNYKNPNKKYWKFIMPCAKEGCNGFVSTAGKCESCEQYTCLNCHVFKGKERNEGHTCKQEDVDSVLEIKKNTRRCPECAVPIHRIKGCTQMFCTECHTCFSYRTGEVYKTAVHNPERDRWMNAGAPEARRKRKSSAMSSSSSSSSSSSVCQQSLPDSHSMRPVHQFLHRYINLVNPHIHPRSFLSIYNGIGHLESQFLPRCREYLQNMDNKMLRIHHVLNKIDDETMKKRLELEDRRRTHIRQIYQVSQLLHEVCVEAMHYIRTHVGPDGIRSGLKQIEKIVNHTKARLYEIQTMNKLKIPVLQSQTLFRFGSYNWP